MNNAEGIDMSVQEYNNGTDNREQLQGTDNWDTPTRNINKDNLDTPTGNMNNENWADYWDTPINDINTDNWAAPTGNRPLGHTDK